MYILFVNLPDFHTGQLYNGREKKKIKKEINDQICLTFFYILELTLVIDIVTSFC